MTLKTFKYTEMITNDFDYCGVVDFHNAKMHNGGTKCGLLMKETWRTSNWTTCVISFILAITEVNAFLVMRFLVVGRGLNWRFTKNIGI